MSVDYQKDFLGTAISPSSARLMARSEIAIFARIGIEISEKIAEQLVVENIVVEKTGRSDLAPVRRSLQQN